MIEATPIFSIMIEPTPILQGYDKRLLRFYSAMIQATPILQRYDTGYSDFGSAMIRGYSDFVAS
jgi:hypothetical protein